MSFTAHDITPRIGTRIEADKATLLGGEHATHIRELLEQRGVLVFPKIGMDDEEQLAFAATIGDVINQGEKGIYKVTLDTKVTPSAEYLRGTVLWHFDGWADDVPARGSILSGRVLSVTGGQTEFANTYAGYDDLPEEKKAAIEGVQAAHTMASTQRGIFTDASDEMKADWDRYPPKLHPLVWTHRSGRKSLLLGSSTDWVDGMDKDEGRALIDELQTFTTRPELVYRHEWEVGDMVIWDNCGVLHRVQPYPADSGRTMHRVTLEGEEAIA
ncbi:MAG TPA: TauD/TfdA family dioxygenase [Sphingobium sp.]|uniref:TauD/TfdA dioxygenase family protein n=1 Tax=Sphingobium sp. TaxID=1912891 RepID=UPI002ED44D13